MSAVLGFLLRHRFLVLCGIYGAASSAVGANVLTGSYWVGMAFGIAVYVGCSVEDWP